MSKYILTIDQGTTSSRVVVYDCHGNPICIKSRPFEQILPEPGWVLHDAEVIYNDVVELMVSALESVNIDFKNICGVGITNQRETTVVWDKETGKPISKAIVWQSVQSKDICDKLEEQGYTDLIREKTGLIINPYFSATKIRWIMDHVAGAERAMNAGNLLFGTIESWLIWKLTGVHITDYTNASRTMLFNIHELCWDEDILNILRLNKNILPKVVPNSGFIANITEPRITKYGNFAINGVAGDQQASLIGHTCFDVGSMKITYGTGSFMLVNTGTEVAKSNHSLLSTIAYNINGKTTYALEGSVFIAGSGFQFIKDNLEIVKDFTPEAFEPKTSNGVYFVPALTGLGAPYWNPDARGAIFGLTRGTKKSDIAWATIEAISYMNKDVIECMREDTGLEIGEITVDGGCTKNSYLMQFQADSTGSKIKTVVNPETTSLGVFYLAGLASGIFNSFDEIKALYKTKKQFIPSGDEDVLDKKYAKWKKAVHACMEF